MEDAINHLLKWVVFSNRNVKKIGGAAVPGIELMNIWLRIELADAYDRVKCPVVEYYITYQYA